MRVQHKKGTRIRAWREWSSMSVVNVNNNKVGGQSVVRLENVPNALE